MTTEKQTHEFKVGSPAELLVKNIRGDVEIVPGEDGLIKVEVITYPDDGSADDTRIELTQEAGGRVRAEVSVPDRIFSYRRPLRVDFRIQAPVRADIKARLVSGSLHARGFRGHIDLGTVSGQVQAEDLEGRLDLDSVSGKIAGSGLRGEAGVSVVSGKVSLRGCDFPALNLSAVSGRAEVETQFGPGPYKLSAVSGSLLLVAPAGSGCHVDASAVSGKFYTDLDISQSSVSKRRWRIQVGEGGPEVRLKTVSGKMQLLSSFDARGRVPGEVSQPRRERKQILDRLSAGEISVDEAVKELAPFSEI